MGKKSGFIKWLQSVGVLKTPEDEVGLSSSNPVSMSSGTIDSYTLLVALRRKRGAN